MALSNDHREQLINFFQNTGFSEKGAVITDLDGTAIHEWEGRYGVPIMGGALWGANTCRGGIEGYL
jgi:hypothetical protein